MYICSADTDRYRVRQRPRRWMDYQPNNAMCRDDILRSKMLGKVISLFMYESPMVAG